jgi:nicotinate-nucleotide adenylyltransferase
MDLDQQLNQLKIISENFPWFGQGSSFLDEVIFYGGSFNPFHLGHLECLKQLNLPQQVILVPDHNPLKDLRTIDSPLEFYEDLCQKTSGLCLGVYPGFLLQEKKNPTYFWMKELKSKYPQQKFSLLVGADSFMQFHRWVEYEKLLKLIETLYVVPRLVSDQELEVQTMQLKKISEATKIKILNHHLFEDISSTEIRKKNSLQKK